jgi:hypothetical protein
VISIAARGGWSARPEDPIDPGASRSRSIDVHLTRSRGTEHVVVEVVDLLADAGATLRNLSDKTAAVQRRIPPGARVQGLLVLRSTTRNRANLSALPRLFASRFEGSSKQWLGALENAAVAMPDADGLIWSTASGDRLRAVGVPRRSPPSITRPRDHENAYPRPVAENAVPLINSRDAGRLAGPGA